MSKIKAVSVRVKQSFDVDVELDDIIQVIQEMPLAQRLNVIASLINDIDTESDHIDPEQTELIIDWLQDKLTDWNELSARQKLQKKN